MNRKNAQKTQRYKSKHLSKHLIWHHCIITVSHISTHKRTKDVVGCRPIFHRNYSSIHSIQQGNQKLQWHERKKRIKLQSEHIDSFSLLPLLSSLQNQPSLANLLSSLSLSISSTGSTITDGRRGEERRGPPRPTHLLPSPYFPLSHSGALSTGSTELASAHMDALVSGRGGGRESVTITHHIPQMCTMMCVQSLQTHYQQFAVCRVVGVCPASQVAVFD